jgi:hypothetical protein
MTDLKASIVKYLYRKLACQAIFSTLKNCRKIYSPLSTGPISAGHPPNRRLYTTASGQPMVSSPTARAISLHPLSYLPPLNSSLSFPRVKLHRTLCSIRTTSTSLYVRGVAWTH